MFLLSCLEKNFLINHITLTEKQAAVVQETVETKPAEELQWV